MYFLTFPPLQRCFINKTTKNIMKLKQEENKRHKQEHLKIIMKRCKKKGEEEEMFVPSIQTM